MVVAKDREEFTLLNQTALYFDSADTEWYPFSRSLICSLVLPCEVSREGTIISVLQETYGHMVEHPQGWMKKEVFVLPTQTICTIHIQMGIKDEGGKWTSQQLSPSPHVGNSRNMQLPISGHRLL